MPIIVCENLGLNIWNFLRNDEIFWKQILVSKKLWQLKYVFWFWCLLRQFGLLLIHINSNEVVEMI